MSSPVTTIAEIGKHEGQTVMIRGNGSFTPSRQDYIQRFDAAFKDPTTVRYERIPDKIEMSVAAPLAASPALGLRPSTSA